MTCNAIDRYHINTDNAIIYLNYVCSYCSFFTHLSKLSIIPTDNIVIAIVFTIDILCFDQFDFYKCLS